MMKVQFKLLCFLIILVSLISCTEIFYPEIDDDVSTLIVDGKITNGIGTCEVRLFRTVKFTDKYDLKPEMDAIIILHDDRDRTEVLTEHEPGIYRNASLIIEGEVGSSYWIEIQTLSGDKYESDQELMPAAFEISSLYGEKIEVLTGNSLKREGVRIYYNAKNNDNKSAFLKWEYQESYEWHSPFRNARPQSENPSRICFPVNTFSQINVFDASNYSVKEVDHLPISTIFDNEVKLLHDYLVDLKVYSISQQNYIFWKNMKSIQQSNGGLYDIIPANIMGNISGCSNSCQVLGYFEVSSVRTSKKTFNHNNFNIEFVDFPEECEEFTMTLEDGIKPDPTRFHVISQVPGDKVVIYTVRFLECYECNVKYPVKKPSFWP